MKVIYKYEVAAQITMPKGAEIVDFQIQHGKFFVWAVVNPHEPMIEIRRFMVFGTGKPFEDKYRYVGMVQNGEYVRHLLEWIV